MDSSSLYDAYASLDSLPLVLRLSDARVAFLFLSKYFLTRTFATALTADVMKIHMSSNKILAIVSPAFLPLKGED